MQNAVYQWVRELVMLFKHTEIVLEWTKAQQRNKPFSFVIFAAAVALALHQGNRHWNQTVKLSGDYQHTKFYYFSFVIFAAAVALTLHQGNRNWNQTVKLSGDDQHTQFY